MNNTKLTLDYYNEKAKDFCQNTLNANMGEFQKLFLNLIPKGGKILDLGCGSGRDSKAFKLAGYNVTALDGSKELCKAASEFIGQDVICSTFQEYQTDERFDGIWACASLLHLNENDMIEVIKRLSSNLTPSGCWYISLKCEDFEGVRNGRYFKSMTQEAFIEFVKLLPELTLKSVTISTDVRPNRENEKWINAFLIKKG